MFCAELCRVVVTLGIIQHSFSQSKEAYQTYKAVQEVLVIYKFFALFVDGFPQ